MGAGGVQNGLPPGRRENRATGAGRGCWGEDGGVIWATGPKPRVGAAGESALEGLRRPQGGVDAMGGL